MTATVKEPRKKATLSTVSGGELVAPHLTDDPGWSAANAKLIALQTKLEETESEEDRIRELSRQAAVSTGNAQELMARADALLSGKTLDTPDYRSQLSRLASERALLEQAIRVQRDLVEAARREASLKVGRECWDAYRKVAAEGVRLLVEAAREFARCDSFYEEIQRAGFLRCAPLKPASPPNYGSLNDPHCGLRTLIQEFVRDFEIDPASDWLPKPIE